jgi:hypothetical protein
MSQFPLRVPDHVLDEARQAAQEDHVSMNQLLLSFIADGLGHRRGLKMMRERASRGDPKAALELLDSLPSLPPEPGDEMPEEDEGRSPGLR